MTSPPAPGSRRPGLGLAHLGWIPAGAGVGFVASLVFGDLIRMPVDLYYLLYFVAVGGFLAWYARATRLDLGRLARRRVPWALGLGLLGGVALVRGVLTQPPTPPLGGGALGLALVWRGLAYGLADGLLLLAFPWLVAWRALGGEERALPGKVGVAVIAWLGVLLVTTAYHLGYRDFRSAKVVQPNVGSTIGILPTLLSANPLASPVSHAVLHVAAVLHCPATDLFLPPHRD